MYYSLKRNCPAFHLYIFPFDDKAEEILRKLSLLNVTIVSLQEFEDAELLAVKDSRSKGEYCWTCTPSIIKYCINTYGLESCTYIDADLYFYSNPNILIDEMGNNSILITEHRYSKRYDKSKRSGIFCVQFITFKNNRAGLVALNWWRERCLEWCYSRIEDGKFGDQKYLDDWATRFNEVHVLKHLGGGVAPWNVQQYEVSKIDESIDITHRSGSFQLIFYHFHDVKFYNADKVDLGIYQLSPTVLREIYGNYLLDILKIENMLINNFLFDRKLQDYLYKKKLIIPIHRLVRIILGVYHIYDLKKIKDGAFDRP